MSGEKLVVHFTPSGNALLEAMAENSGVSLALFMQQTIDLGVFCADELIANRARGVETSIFLEEEPEGYVEYPLCFDVTESDCGTSPVDDGPADPFLEDEEFHVHFHEAARERIDRIVAALGTSAEGFVEEAVNLRWNLGRLASQGRKMLLTTSNDEYFELGIID